MRTEQEIRDRLNNIYEDIRNYGSVKWMVEERDLLLWVLGEIE